MEISMIFSFKITKKGPEGEGWFQNDTFKKKNSKTTFFL